MRERAEAVGGALEVRLAPGEGTRVLVRVPLDREPVAAAPPSAAGGQREHGQVPPAQLLDKLYLQNRAQVVAFALRSGLVEPPAS